MKQMKHCLAVSAAVMLLLPWLTVTLVKDDAAMALCLLLFYVVNPLYSICTGVMSGKRPREGWWLPLSVSVLFLFGSWIFFDMGESAFLLYAAVYLVFGYSSMMITHLIKSIRQKPFR